MEHKIISPAYDKWECSCGVIGIGYKDAEKHLKFINALKKERDKELEKT